MTQYIQYLDKFSIFNIVTPDRVRLYPSDQQLTFCTLNARSLNNKSAAFVDLVCDVRADLFTVCETWLKDHHSAVLSELTPPSLRASSPIWAS